MAQFFLRDPILLVSCGPIFLYSGAERVHLIVYIKQFQWSFVFVFFCRSRQSSELREFEKPKEDQKPDFEFDLRPRLIQAGCEFKLITVVQATPPPTVNFKVLCMLIKNFSRWHFEILFTFSQKIGFDISKETICMKCQSPFSGEKKKEKKKKKNIYSFCHLLNLAKTVVKVK